MNKKCGNCEFNQSSDLELRNKCIGCNLRSSWKPVNKYKRKIKALEQRMVKQRKRVAYRESKRLEKIEKKKLKREQKEMLSNIVGIQKRGYDNTLDIKIIKDVLSECRLNVSRLNNQVYEQAEIISELRLLVDINTEATKNAYESRFDQSNLTEKEPKKSCNNCIHHVTDFKYGGKKCDTQHCVNKSKWALKEPVNIRSDVKIISDVEHYCTNCKYSKLKNNNGKCPYAVDGSCYYLNKWEKYVEEPTVEKKCSNCKFSGENTNSFCCTKMCDDTHSKWEFISDGEKIENSPQCKSCRYSIHNNGEGLSCVDYRINHCIYTTCNNFSEWKAVIVG